MKASPMAISLICVLFAVQPAAAQRGGIQAFLELQGENNDDGGAGTPVSSLCSDPTLGLNDQRVSDMGGLGTPSIHVAEDPAIAYNSIAREHLVVWAGTEGNAATEQTKIYGQLLDAATEAEISPNDLVLGVTPGVADPARDASSPGVAYSTVRNEYLVVWVGQPNTTATESEVFGQRVAADGSPVGSAFQISTCGAPGDTSADVGALIGRPLDVCYDETDDRYLVVWRCDNVGFDAGGGGGGGGAGGLELIANGEFEIFGRLVNGNGTLFGAGDFQISQTGGVNGINTQYDAESPSCTWNSVDNEFLVTWGADQPALGDGNREIHGQFLDSLGTEIGADDFQISDTAHAGSRDSAVSDAVHASSTNEYLVVWSGDTITDNIVDIFGVFVAGEGGGAGTTPGSIIQISSTGTLANPSNAPQVVYNSLECDFLVTWQASTLTAGELEIFGQRLECDGTNVGEQDFQISDLGPDGNTSFSAEPTHGLVYANGGSGGMNAFNSYRVAFSGQDNRDGQVQGENEIFAQLVDPILEIEKTILSATSGVDAGDTIVYEIVVRHKEVTEDSDTHPVSLRDAFDVGVLEVIPDILAGVTLVSAEVDDGVTNTDVSAAFAFDPDGNLETIGNVNLLRRTNGDNHQELTIVVQGTIPDDVAPNDVVGPNSAALFWKNINAESTHPGYCGIAEAEALDVVDVFDVTKRVVGSDVAPIGSTVTYQLEVEVFEGTTTGIELVDTLPGGSGDGLSYVPGSAIVSDPNGMTITGFTDNGGPVGQILTLNIDSVVNPGDVDDPSATDSDSFLITYQVEVDPAPAGLTLTNDVDATADNLPPDENNSVDLTVTKVDTTTVILSDNPDPSVTGQPVVVAYSVTSDEPLSVTPTGAVDVAINGDVCAGTVASGMCTVTPMTAGSIVTATYEGDPTFNPSMASTDHTVLPADTTTTIVSDDPDPSGIGAPITVEVTVTANSPGSGTPTGTVDVDDGDGATCTVTLVDGMGSCTLTPIGQGVKTLTAQYSGDPNYNPSTGTDNHTVDKAPTTTTISITSDAPDPSIVNQPVLVTFLVEPGPDGAPGGVDLGEGAGGPLPVLTGTVTVMADTGEVCSSPVDAGACSLILGSAGIRTLTARYNGDSNFAVSESDPELHEVLKGNVTLTITSDEPDPSMPGEDVMVTYTVEAQDKIVAPLAGGGASGAHIAFPTGTVTITADTGESCAGTVVDGMCVLALNTPGLRTLTAAYSGDDNFLPADDMEDHVVEELVPENVNGLLLLDDLSTGFSFAPCGASPADGGTLVIHASFTNISSSDLRNISFQITALSGGNVICNADDCAPQCPPGGTVGSSLLVPLPFSGPYADGTLEPGASFAVRFEVGLASYDAFEFFVDAYAVVDEGDPD